MKVLVARGADLSARSDDNWRGSPLNWALGLQEKPPLRRDDRAELLEYLKEVTPSSPK